MNDDVPLAHSAKKDEGISSQTYAEHIAGVLKRNDKNVSSMMTFFNGDAQLLKDTIHSSAVLHDLGKLDPKNQKVLKTGGKRKLSINHVDAGTAQLSICDNKEAAILVYGHHIGLCSIPTEAVRKDLFLRDSEIREHTDPNLDAYVELHERYCGQISVGSICHKTGWSALTRRLAFSCLVDADHGDTAHHYGAKDVQHVVQPRWEERLSALDVYVDGLAKKFSSSSRAKERQEVYRACRDADVNSNIYACDSPVGTGKTTAVMANLLRVAQKKELRHIFVILPYTNIIKQSVEIYRESLVLPDENPEAVVAELHHQADFSDEGLRRYAALWTSPVIVTTAVQFFETLSGFYPSRLRKLHELPGSAIFIDEAHAAIPTYLWPQAWKWLHELRKSWGCHVVLASGSLPQFWLNSKIDDSKDQVSSLLSETVHNSVHLAEDRRIVYLRYEPLMDSDELINFVNSKVGPRLVILNTVQSAAVLAEKMREQKNKVMHLSTALTPKDREKIVDLIKQRLDEKKDKDWTLVATSCVESGMDFSFATAFRESCSAASLIQIGGRVNRHSENGIAEVWDFKVSDPMMCNNRQFDVSRNVLQKLFEDEYFECGRKSATEIVTRAMEMELMSDFGDFSKKSDEIKKYENHNDFPLVAKLSRVINSDTRMVVISEKIADDMINYKKVKTINLIRNSVQIRFYKINTPEFKAFCSPINTSDEIYRWCGAYDEKFLGYMAAIVPLLKINVNGYKIL